MAFTSADLITKAINLLKAAKAEYSIIGPDGQVYGEVSFKKEKPKKEKMYAHGERTTYARQYISNLVPGEVVDVPFDKYKGEALRGSLAAEINRLYGAGAVTTTLDLKRRVIQVLRVS